ncbi:hypothetical protein HF086_003555 [Spodoptera exigua]|uniref:General transcription factor IIH subunit 4 n=1 Tax=Spodoptera exigua TaxID=7107 RepID=A0A922MMD5_SPOEX|nr:hypothetical protein HF086_003555 [Spodoptera exigua]
MKCGELDGAPLCARPCACTGKLHSYASLAYLCADKDKMSESSKSKSSLNLNPSPTLQCKDLHEYLKSRSAQFLETLYNYPTICLAVYRELPELARHFVIRLLFVEQPVPQAVVTSWVSQTFAKEQAKACEALSELSVWQEAPIPGGMPGWMLAQSFKKNLKVALLGGGRAWSMSSSLEPDGKARDVAFLDAYALERWECVLHYMVGSAQTEGISADAVRILLHAGLMTRYDYSTEGMSNNMLVFLQHLREFGLVYQRKRKAGRFYPTRLALNIAQVRGVGATPLAAPAQARGYIVVETNYRVFPNLVVGVLTRESVRQALRGGITAEQIIHYLEQHSHPQASCLIISLNCVHF